MGFVAELSILWCEILVMNSDEIVRKKSFPGDWKL